MTRERRWSHDIESHWVTRPTISDGTVFVGVGYTDATGTVLGFDIEGGNRTFEYSCGREVETRPITDSDGLYVAPNDGSLRCLSPDNGRQHWTCQTPAGVVSPMAVIGTTLYALTIRGHVLAVDTTEGSVRWQWSGIGAAQSGVVVNGTTVYVGTADGCVTALNRRTGFVRWRRSLGSGVVGRPAVVDDTLMIAMFDGSVRALCSQTGDDRWQASVGVCVVGPAIAGSRVVVGDKTGTIHAFERRTGAKRWKTSLESGISVTLAVAKERAEVLTDAGQLASLSITDGAIHSSASAPVPSPTGALLVGDGVCFLAGSGRLVCFDE